MKTTSFYLKIALPLFALAILTAAPKASGDTYSWTNFQSDIAGVAQHIDENLVNPWGMAVSPNGTIWVSLGDRPYRLRCRGRTEGHFDHGESAREEGPGQRHRIGGVVQDDHGDDGSKIEQRC